jgi:ADP-heptose:LPS heptosyltransferase
MNSNIITGGLLLTQIADKPESEHRYDYNLNLLRYLGIKNIYPAKFPSIDFNSINIGMKKKDEISVLIHPCAGWIYRQWPLNSWVKLIQKLSDNKRIKMTVIGGKAEREKLAQIFSSVNDDKIEFKTTNLKDLIASIKYSDLFICTDSGPMNLAVCMDKPVIALFGPGDSDMWRPYSSKSSFIHKKENFPCNPCLQKKCYYPENNCMAEISVDDVLDSVKSFINSIKNQNNFNNS